VANHQPLPLVDFASVDLNEEQAQLRRKTHQTLQKVTDDYGRRHTFNTAIAATMELLNTVTRFSDANKGKTDCLVIQESLESAILMLAPIVPHFCHTLWQYLGHEEAVMNAAWPKVDESALIQNTATVVLQVNGKLRGKIEVSKDISKEELEKLALSNESVARFLAEGTVRKVIVVPGRLVNIVVN
jgi:leucyl-tRNA synthetase